MVGFGIGLGSWPAALSTAGEPDLVVADRETGIARAVAEQCPGTRHQRCEWHLPYRLKYMFGREGIPVRRQRRIAGEVTTLLRETSPENRARYNALVAGLHNQPRSQWLLEKAADRLSIEQPSLERSTGIVERIMREIDRRADNGAQWSVAGLGNLLKLRLAKRLNLDNYDRLWRPIRGLHASVMAHA